MVARVLVVDDDDATTRMMALGLRSEGREVETAIEAMRAGAYDFVTKRFDIDGLEVEKRYILKVMQAAAGNKSLAAHTWE